MRIYLQLTLATVFWGGTFVAGRLLSMELDPFSAAFLRFLLASLVLSMVTLRIERRIPCIPKEQWFWIFLLGMTGVFAYNVFFFLGLQSIQAGRAALIIALNPISIALFSSLFFRERLTALKGIGILFCLTGAGVVIARGNPLNLLHGEIGQGELALLGCVISWTAYSLIGKRVMASLTPLTAVTGSCIVGTAALLIPALTQGLVSDLAGISLQGWVTISYLGIFGTGLGFCWYYQGIKAIGPTRAGVFINLVPLVGVVLGGLILGETLTPALILGGLLVFTGLFLTNYQAIPLLNRLLHRPKWL
ncbi:MAG: DMT family transporter, partial [Desulfovibrionales bacterium]